MPFTLAHPAAVLPLRGATRLLRAAPLIIGSMVPDVPYYLPANLHRDVPETHHFRDSYTVCLLLGYVVLALLYVLRRPLTALLSPRARWLCLHALAPFGRSALEWLFAACALLIGIWSHLLWDSFTHVDGWFVRRVAALSAPVSIAGYEGPLCRLLQYVSSVLGLLVLLVWYLRLPVPPVPRAAAHAPRTAAGPALALIVCAAVLIGAVQATESFYHLGGIYHTVDIFLTHGLTWFALLYLLAGALVTLEQDHEHAAVKL
jgi:Domain of unknown function (DUF4184)